MSIGGRFLFRTALVCLVILPAAAFLGFYLPRHEVVRIVGSEVRRIDLDGQPGGETRDVFFIYGETLGTQRPRVYRNDDTGWRFPFYFKFNAADLQAVAAAIATDRGMAVVTRYGWRIQLLSRFPNAVALRRTEDVTEPFPWFNTVFFVALFVLALLIWRAVRRWRSRVT
ncbi:MAG TPA: DUF1523 family protein [Roseomonas sp.]|jgi:hypothetical protein